MKNRKAWGKILGENENLEWVGELARLLTSLPVLAGLLEVVTDRSFVAVESVCQVYVSKGWI